MKPLLDNQKMTNDEKRNFLFNSWIGPIFNEFELTTGKILNETELDFYIQNLLTSYEKVSRPRLWLEKTIEASHRLENSDHVTSLDLDSFFICINGVIDEIPKFYRKNIDTWKEHDLYDQLKATSFGNFIVKIVEASESFNKEFSEDELLYIDVQRQFSSHVNPTGFEIKINVSKNGEISLNRKYKDGKDAHEVDKVISDMHRAHTDRLGAAIYLKNKSVDSFNRLVTAISDYTTQK
ncbi:MAG: hypothetical protein JSU04_20380 [Bdellovibrionales bacterium]|nr:hypothetical protein [Bdellovibrionales bacterium]